MKLFLLRHGQSQWQLERKGDLDAPLTSVGREQSRRLAEWLGSNERFDLHTHLDAGCVCVSPMKRARETAAYVLSMLQLPEVVQENLTEAPFRVADHLCSADTPFRHAADYIPSEPYHNFKSQAATALRELAEYAEAHNGTILAITHAGLISTMFRLVVACDAIAFKPYNAALNLLEWKHGCWRLTYVNFWDYLPVGLRTS